LIEWDAEIPALEVLVAEAMHAQALLRACPTDAGAAHAA
jgi:uncharacterized protein (UPF0276 family)